MWSKELAVWHLSFFFFLQYDSKGHIYTIMPIVFPQQLPLSDLTKWYVHWIYPGKKTNESNSICFIYEPKKTNTCSEICLLGSPLETCWIHTSKILMEKEVSKKNQDTWDHCLGHYVIVLAVVLSLLSHKSVFRTGCTHSHHTKLSTTLSVTIKPCLLSDCELRTTE